MRIRKVKLQNVRIHRELEVVFENGLNILGGANETGKSTLVRALHRAFFVSHRTGGKLTEWLESKFGGTPSIEVEFELADEAGNTATWTLTKQFRNNESAHLTDGEHSYKNDEAEERLESLFKVKQIGGRSSEDSLRDTWRHVWNWQGYAMTTDPGKLLEEHFQDMVRLLGGDEDAFFVSGQDAELAKGIDALYNSQYTSTGRYSANSSVKSAEESLKRSEEQQRQQQDLVDKLESRIGKVGRLSEELKQTQQTKEEKVQELEALEAKQNASEEIQSEYKEKEKDREERSVKILALEKTLKESEQLKKELEELLAAKKNLETELSPKEDELKALEETKMERVNSLNKARELLTEQQGKLDAGIDFQNLQQFKKDKDRIAKKLEIVEQLEVNRDKLKESLREETVDDDAIKVINELVSNAKEAEIRLSAVAAKVTLVNGDGIQINSEELFEGEEKLITKDTTVKGDNFEIHISPGGDESLERLSENLKLSKLELAKKLESVGCGSAKEAEAKFRKRQSIVEQLNTISVKLESGGSESLRDEEAQLDQKIDQINRRRKEENWADAFTEESIEQVLEELRSALETTKQEVTTSKGEVQELDRLLQLKKEILKGVRQKLQSIDNEKTVTETKLEAKLEANGTIDEQRAQLTVLKSEFEKVDREFETLKAKMEELEIPQIESGIERLTKSLETMNKRIQDIHIEVESNRTVLREHLNGESDVQSKLDELTVAVDKANVQFKREVNKALAIKLLRDKLLEILSSNNERMVQPIQESLNEYIRYIFGPNAQIKLNLNENSEVEGLKLARPGVGDFDFEALSGGTREQLSAAFRLATAEALGKETGMPLPVILDDSFAYSDKERIRKLEELLYFGASERGIQILLLTCKPEDYRTAGASRIHRLG